MLEGEVEKLNEAVFGPAAVSHKDSRWGWYLPSNTEHIDNDSWAIINAIPPAAVMYHIGEGVTSDDLRRILDLRPDCHVIMRWFCDPINTPVQTQISKLVEVVTDTSFDFLLKGQKWVQFANEVNTKGGSEGYGDTPDHMKQFNDDWLSMYEQVKAANPDWGIGFTPMTGGNRDIFFPHSEDPLNVSYFFHGPEAARPDPTSVDIALSILSGPCYESLKRADAHFAHTYCINDPDNEKFAYWCGLRWLLQRNFLPNQEIPTFINELGIRGVDHLIDYHNFLIDNHPTVLGTCQYQLQIHEPWGYNGSNPAVIAARTWYNALPEVDPPQPPNPPDPPPPEEEQMRAFVGIHYTNDHNATAAARQAFGAAKFEAVKVFNFTNVTEAALLRQINPDVQFLCRLWSGRFGPGGVRPTPQQFIQDVEIGLGVWLAAGCDQFEIHNEPNETEGSEGFGPTQQDAADYQEWHLLVLNGQAGVFHGLRTLFPTALFGFPGLCPHANDLQWLDWCQEAIKASDFLCVHSYWQKSNHLSLDWGRRYLQYADRYPLMVLEISEWGSSDAAVSWREKAAQYVEWYIDMMGESAGIPIRGAYCFILQSPDWEHFAWVDNDGNDRPMVAAVGAMSRPPLYGEPDPPPDEPPPPPMPVPDFTAEPLSGVAPFEVQFTNLSDGIVGSLRWFFWDNEQSTTWDPKRIYANPGEFNVTLRVWLYPNEQGEYVDCRKVNYITVLSEEPPEPPFPPMIAFYAEPTRGIAPLSVQFYNTSEGEYEAGLIQWDFGDGTLRSGVDDPLHVYTESGLYAVMLTLYQGDKSFPLTKPAYIEALAKPEPEPPPAVRKFHFAVSGTLTLTEAGPDEPPIDADVSRVSVVEESGQLYVA